MKRSSRPLLRCIGHGLLTLLLVLQASMVLALGGAGCATAAVTVTASEAAATPPCHPATPASGLPAGNPAAGEDCLAGGGTWCAWACSLAAGNPPLTALPAALPLPAPPEAFVELLASRSLPVPHEPPRS